MPMPQYSEKERACLIKEERCFSYEEKSHTAYDYPKKEKIVAIYKGVRKDSNSPEKK